MNDPNLGFGLSLVELQIRVKDKILCSTKKRRKKMLEGSEKTIATTEEIARARTRLWDERIHTYV